MKKVHLIGNAHLDPAWLWRWQEGYAEALATFDEALARFPDAAEFKVFRAMVCYNLGRSKEGMESLLAVLAATTTDPAIAPYRRAIALYAEDLDRRW